MNYSKTKLSTCKLALKRFYSTKVATEEGLKEILKKALNPKVLVVQDISGGCGSMFQIAVVSKEFEKMSVLKQHKLVHELLKDDIPSMHGLRLQTMSESKYNKKQEAVDEI